MSSTNRGKRGGDGTDLFQTPSWATRRIVERLHYLFHDQATILEPNAGEGGIIEATTAVVGRRNWTAIEIREDAIPHLTRRSPPGIDICQGDFLELVRTGVLRPEHPRKIHVAIGNPAFKIAFEVTKACLDLADDVLILERSPWIGDSTERYEFFRNRMPNEYRIGRCDFDGNGGDSIPYSWFHWDTRWEPRSVGGVELLEPSTKAEREQAKRERIEYRQMTLIQEPRGRLPWLL